MSMKEVARGQRGARQGGERPTTPRCRSLPRIIRYAPLPVFRNSLRYRIAASYDYVFFTRQIWGIDTVWLAGKHNPTIRGSKELTQARGSQCALRESTGSGGSISPVRPGSLPRALPPRRFPARRTLRMLAGSVWIPSSRFTSCQSKVDRINLAVIRECSRAGRAMRRGPREAPRSDFGRLRRGFVPNLNKG